MKIKGLISEKTVVLKYDGQEINIQRSQDEKIFLKISQLLIDGKQEELISEFLDIKAKIENFSENTFTVKDQKIVLKDDSTAIPQAIAKKLLAEYIAPMANQSLTEQEARKVLEYFRTKTSATDE
jgi:hypothetical protein